MKQFQDGDFVVDVGDNGSLVRNKLSLNSSESLCFL